MTYIRTCAATQNGAKQLICKGNKVSPKEP